MIIEKKPNGKIIVFDDDYNILYAFDSSENFNKEFLTLQSMNEPLTNDELEEMQHLKHKLDQLNQKDLDNAAFKYRGLDKTLNDYIEINSSLKDK